LDSRKKNAQTLLTTGLETPSCLHVEFRNLVKNGCQQGRDKIRFRISGGLLFYSQNTLIVVPPAILHNTTTTTTLSNTNNVDDSTNNVDDIRQHSSHDGNKGVNRNGQ
jgi:hypothetical protein